MRVSVILLALLISSCGTTERIVTKQVKVVVTNPCEAEEVPVQSYPMDSIPSNASFGVKGATALAEIELRAATETKLRAALKGCTDKVPDKVEETSDGK